jgi:hypothetical protein
MRAASDGLPRNRQRGLRERRHVFNESLGQFLGEQWNGTGTLSNLMHNALGDCLRGDRFDQVNGLACHQSLKPLGDHVRLVVEA